MKTIVVHRMAFLSIYDSHFYSKSSLSTSSALVKFTLLFIIFLYASTCCDAGPKRSRSFDKYQALPECVDESSVCGYVQLNSMGVSGQPICRCKNGISCPLLWDPFDGRTVMHGNDQYKYCNRAPKLNPCSKEEVVYSTYMEMSLITMDTLLNTNHIHCLCPASSLFIRNATKFHDMDDGTSVIGTTHQCKPPPRCDINDACMAITESAHSSFITRKCACPIGMFCPIDIRLSSERVDLDKGAYYIMKCM